MAVGKISEFNVTNGTWSSYVDRMEMFFLVNAVKEDLKLPTLIAAMGDEAYELLSNLASPKKPSELKYKEAVDLLRHHLQPTPSVLAERYRFRQRRQNNDENIAGYVAELKKLARNCKFDVSLNENLRDQFVCGLRSDVIRQRLFAEDDSLSYTNAVKIASSLEAAERDAAAVEPGPGLSTGSGGVAPGASAAMYALASGSSARHQAPRSRSRTSGRSRSASGAARGVTGGRRGAGRGGSAGYGPGGGEGHRNCGGCGATDHDYNDCRFRGYVCSLCQRKGHLRRVCPDRAGTGRGGSAPGRLYYGQAATPAEDSDRDEGATEEDFHHLCLNDYGPASSGAEPQVAVLCEAGSTYHPQYMSAAGRWTPDLTTKPHNCLKDKMEILDYCKKVYPSHDITNIVEASHYVKVSNWCKLGSGNAAKCKVTRWVKPFRCLEGPFQSDALLVPESCLFDHIHNQSRCWQFARWNATAGRACAQRGLRLRTFAMLLPCGISLFSGVEFVCCPKHFKENVKMHKPMDVGVPVSPGGEEMLAASAAMDERDDDLLDDDDALDDDDDDDTLNLSDDDDDDDADDDMDEDEDADLSRDDDSEDDDYTDGDDNAWPRPESSSAPSTTPTTTTTTTTTTASTATSDPYFSHFDPRTEHQSYKDAQQRLEETHREKITKVMKEWSELEDRYQQMMTSDPSSAQTFRQRMTAKFQANVQALEEEGVAERRRLAALHQQRVLAHLAQRRRTALACYTRSLRDTPPNAHRVQKCLQRLVRALAAERSGALAAWRRAAAAGREAAAAERASAADRLQDADRALQRALTSLRRRPHLYNNIGTAIEDYVQSMQSKDDMAVSLMSMTPEAEELLLDRIEAEVQREQAAREQLSAKRDQRTRQRQDIQEERTRTSNGVKETEETDDEASEVNDAEETTVAPTTQGPPPSPSASPAPSASSVSVHDITTRAAYTQETTTTEIITSTVTEAPEIETGETDVAGETSSRRSTSETEGEGLRAALEHAEERAPPPPAHTLKHEVSHSQPGFTVRSSGSNGGSGALYPALCVGGAALAAAAAVALAVARRRERSPQGFVQVEQTGAVAPTPEERHVANMQINGYENPTYKYFEVKE